MTAHTDGASRNESRSEGLELPPDTASASRARRYVRERLLATGHPELVECAVLCVDELVANACVHARTTLVLAVHGEHDPVRSEVTDYSKELPVRQEAGRPTYAVGGRGLTLLDACGMWGIAIPPDRGGKTIWFEPSATMR